MMLFSLHAVLLASEGDPVRTLYTFEQAGAAKQWQTVNDGVMGGVSEGNFKITDQGTLEFFGSLSLENNGGFASVRTYPGQLDLAERDVLLARVRGDGREYYFNLYVPTDRTAFSYRAAFKTRKNEWINVELPLRDFKATSFGRVVGGPPSEPAKVHGLGFLLADKKAGPFQLEVQWIQVRDAAAAGSKAD